MKNKRTEDPDDNLTRRLQEWVVDAAPPPHFPEQVWRRIERLQSASEPSWVTSLAAFLSAFSQPRVAYAVAVVLVALGIAAGSWTAQHASQQTTIELKERYVRAVDPFSVSP